MVQKARDEFDECLGKAKLLNNDAFETLHVGMLTGAGSYVIPQAVRQLQSVRPFTTCSIDTYSFTRSISALRNGTCDVMLTIDLGLSKHPEIECTELFSVRYVILYSSYSGLASISCPGVADLKDELFLLPNGDDKALTENILRQLGLTYGFTPKMKACTSNLESVFNMVDSGADGYMTRG